MKWRQIVIDYPYAFEKLCAHSIGADDWKELGWRVEIPPKAFFRGPIAYDETGAEAGSLGDGPVRLYRFFDEAGIFLKVTPTHQMPCEFLAAIITERASRGVGGAELVRFAKRQQAEEAAFMLAFEVLEAQLQPVPA